MRYGSVHARRQRFSIIHLGGAVLGGNVPQKEDYAQGTRRETPFKIFHGEEANLSHLCAIGARTSVHIEDSRKLDAAAWEGKVCSCSEEAKSYRVWNPKTHRVVESRNVTFTETPPHLLPPPSKLSPLQDRVPSSWDLTVAL